MVVVGGATYLPKVNRTSLMSQLVSDSAVGLPCIVETNLELIKLEASSRE